MGPQPSAVLLRLWCRLQLRLGFDPWPRELLHVAGVAKKEKKKKCLYNMTISGNPSHSTEMESTYKHKCVII